MTKLQFNFYKFTRSGTEEEFTELNQLLEDNYLRTSLFTCETLLQQKCEAKQKGEDDRRKGEEMRRAAMMSMFHYMPLIRLISHVVIAMQVGALYQQ